MIVLPSVNFRTFEVVSSINIKPIGLIVKGTASNNIIELANASNIKAADSTNKGVEFTYNLIKSTIPQVKVYLIKLGTSNFVSANKSNIFTTLKISNYDRNYILNIGGKLVPINDASTIDHFITYLNGLKELNLKAVKQGNFYITFNQKVSIDVVSGDATQITVGVNSTALADGSISNVGVLDGIANDYGIGAFYLNDLTTNAIINDKDYFIFEFNNTVTSPNSNSAIKFLNGYYNGIDCSAHSLIAFYQRLYSLNGFSPSDEVNINNLNLVPLASNVDIQKQTTQNAFNDGLNEAYLNDNGKVVLTNIIVNKTPASDDLFKLLSDNIKYEAIKNNLKKTFANLSGKTIVSGANTTSINQISENELPAIFKSELQYFISIGVIDSFKNVKYSRDASVVNFSADISLSNSINTINVSFNVSL